MTAPRPAAPVDNASAAGPILATLPPMDRRFLTLPEVAEELNISAAQTYALVRSGQLKAMKVGGRGQWRVETTKLEDYITQAYADTEKYIAEHPPGGQDGQGETDGETGPPPGDG